MDESEPENQFPNIRKFNSKLAENENLSDHNKRILDKFFDWHEHRVSIGTCKDYASRWNTLAEHIDFKLDEAERHHLLDIAERLEADEIRSQEGKRLSEDSKDKTLDALSVIYRKFIKYKGRGEIERLKDMDGPTRVRGLSDIIDEDSDNKVIKETKPNPSQVKKVAESIDNLRDRALIVFCWASGCRIGEVFPTDDKPEYLRWRDINFGNDDTIAVRLRKDFKKEEGDPDRRNIDFTVSRPLMMKLREEQNPDLDDPVFPKKDATLYCPKCDNRVKEAAKDRDTAMSTSSRRDYKCKECSWQGKSDKVNRRREPLTDAGARNVLKNAVEESDVQGINKTPHKFFRKGRALHRQAMRWGEGGIRDFFGWSENSREPSRYKDSLRVNQKQELKEEHPNLDIDVEGRFYDESLRPVKCSKCETVNSRLWDFCNNCGHELTFQGLVMKDSDPESKKNRIKHEVKNEGIEFLLKKSEVKETEFKERLTTALDKRLEKETFSEDSVNPDSEDELENLADKLFWMVVSRFYEVITRFSANLLNCTNQVFLTSSRLKRNSDVNPAIRTGITS